MIVSVVSVFMLNPLFNYPKEHKNQGRPDNKCCGVEYTFIYVRKTTAGQRGQRAD
jgi:hypothetical protein